ncbi:MAG: O-antigen ligase family protein, partial [Bacteroidota bacterium]
EKLMYRFLFLIAISFCITFVVIMGLFLSTGRSPFGLRFNPGPFFADHTVFGAFAAMWVPVLYLLAFRFDLKKRQKQLAQLALLGFLVALFFSYSRGAWASCLLGLILMGVFTLPKSYRRFLLPSTILFVVIGGYVWYMGQGTGTAKNDAVSRKNLKDHVASITNFRTDDSNAERINRWYCAIEMFKERPTTGFGPGTYAFLYGNYQRARYRTSVSTNRGDNGTAHNEFLLAMSETGWMGAIILLGIFIAPIVMGVRGYHRAIKKNTRLLYLAITFGLITYDIHALVNNFLDQDKIGGSYFGFMAIITALDLYVLPKERDEAARAEAKEKELELEAAKLAEEE